MKFAGTLKLMVSIIVLSSMYVFATSIVAKKEKNSMQEEASQAGKMGHGHGHGHDHGHGHGHDHKNHSHKNHKSEHGHQHKMVKQDHSHDKSKDEHHKHGHAHKGDGHRNQKTGQVGHHGHHQKHDKKLNHKHHKESQGHSHKEHVQNHPHHEDSKHNHGDMKKTMNGTDHNKSLQGTNIDAEKAKALAVIALRSKIKLGKLDDSWKSVKPLSSTKGSKNMAGHWIVNFENKLVADKLKQNLVVHINQKGKITDLKYLTK